MSDPGNLYTSTTRRRCDRLLRLVGHRRVGRALFGRERIEIDVGEAVEFAAPKGAKLLATNWKHKGYTKLAEGPKLIQRIPVKLGAK